ncbi:hypothetical protein [Natrarchaeobaculum sulfurireducens]|uniref:DUF8119 domain-containing protein n=1 Tax=Natrarchaeobaculum sulfurireducens TaxID=2044521 RepID=A0A346PH66_9EURY|nr:hypothetical protein [Natrarchaeobaculum sulfurireducens]AXR78861.1 hypothetical protein AArc1_2546 [Natrarchaeobaculum sulfurireducens]AXR81093.1 hypothetical protein AArcMg_1077 [Natrarchaeobaculum sulfurireducens]
MNNTRTENRTEAPDEGTRSADDGTASANDATRSADDRTSSTSDRPSSADSEHTTRPTGSVRTVARAGYRLLADLAIITLWVLFCTLLFLETGWPRWAFYGVLLSGVAIYVSITAPWVGRSRATS